MKEVWKQVGDHEYYEISNYGNVRSWKNARWGRRKEPRLLSKSVDKDGYKNVFLQVDGVRKGHKIHRLVALAFKSNLKNKPEVNHLDGDPGNNYVDNLAWCTAKENIKHAFQYLGRGGHRGELHPCAKLSEKKVKKARTIKKTTPSITWARMARMFEVDASTIRKAVTGKTWGYIN